MIPVIEPCYPGSSQVALLGLAEAYDSDIWAYARVNHFVIVTEDSDLVVPQSA
ncbi:DUF5615 family PIN-like protein [uncultured Thiocystis sp.]|jgi:predicted nuclease of predicted toxin-antitoxin system|uniref:DUF5615 family PIN-like protein n=1 Tax=uncultured Thiocystis sp. TaxID=1202134 RepID=UPI0034281AF1